MPFFFIKKLLRDTKLYCGECARGLSSVWELI
jgi:hypothetical protein